MRLTSTGFPPVCKRSIYHEGPSAATPYATRSITRKGRKGRQENILIERILSLRTWRRGAINFVEVVLLSI